METLSYGAGDREVVGHSLRTNAQGRWLPPRPLVRCHDCGAVMETPAAHQPSYYHICRRCQHYERHLSERYGDNPGPANPPPGKQPKPDLEVGGPRPRWGRRNG